MSGETLDQGTHHIRVFSHLPSAGATLLDCATPPLGLPGGTWCQLIGGSYNVTDPDGFGAGRWEKARQPGDGQWVIRGDRRCSHGQGPDQIWEFNIWELKIWGLTRGDRPSINTHQLSICRCKSIMFSLTQSSGEDQFLVSSAILNHAIKMLVPHPAPVPQCLKIRGSILHARMAL